MRYFITLLDCRCLFACFFSPPSSVTSLPRGGALDWARPRMIDGWICTLVASLVISVGGCGGGGGGVELAPQAICAEVSAGFN